MSNCPCDPTQTYANCCARFHRGEAPDNAEQLMRSRYSAFVLGLIDYIVATTVPSQQALLDKTAIADWSLQTNWQGLTIINHRPIIGKCHAQVEFKAHFNTSDGGRSHHELSAFVRINMDKPRWYFIDPTVALPTGKQACICGSGDKYKRCCGALLD